MSGIADEITVCDVHIWMFGARWETEVYGLIDMSGESTLDRETLHPTPVANLMGTEIKRGGVGVRRDCEPFQPRCKTLGGLGVGLLAVPRKGGADGGPPSLCRAAGLLTQMLC